MTTRPPAEIGMSLDEVDTPALIVDLDAFERNLKRLADRIAGRGVRLRPHAKTHKCPVIALKQVASGRSASACRRSAKPRRWSMAACATCSSPTKSSGGRSCAG